MNTSTSDIITAGKYTFKIAKNILKYDDRIISHTYKVGGDYDDCINISYKYSNNVPISVSMPHLLYEPECAIGSDLERGSGTEILIKSAIQYAYKEVPSITIFKFDDMSHIDCVEKDMTQLPPRKSIKPLNLSYFSIAYHGITWYESRFNAKMIDEAKYKLYKERLVFLTDPEKKVPFERFLEIAQPTEGISYLENIYRSSNTYRIFFESIPTHTRCDILYPWLVTFMKHYLSDVFSEKGWMIDVTDMNSNRKRGGTYMTKTRKHLRNKKYRIYNYSETHNF